jgi:hypothetical protein
MASSSSLISRSLDSYSRCNAVISSRLGGESNDDGTGCSSLNEITSESSSGRGSGSVRHVPSGWGCGFEYKPIIFPEKSR